MRLALGRSHALADGEFLDPAASGRSRVALPMDPRIAWSTRVPGGIGYAVASDERGHIIIAHVEARISELDANGREIWSARLQAEPVSPPIITSSGERYLLLADSSLMAFDALGASRAARLLPLADLRKKTLVIATAAGGLAIAAGLDLLELDARGGVIRRDRARESVAGLVQWKGALVAITSAGNVLSARASGGFEPAGSFGGRVPDGATVAGDELQAVVDGHKLVALNLYTGIARVRAFESLVILAGPPVVLRQGPTWLVADGTSLSERAPDGSETVRVPLESTLRVPNTAERSMRSVFAIADERGVIAVTRGSGDFVVIGVDDKLRSAEGTACAEPLRATPLLPGALAIACRSGQLYRIDSSEPGAVGASR